MRTVYVSFVISLQNLLNIYLFHTLNYLLHIKTHWNEAITLHTCILRLSIAKYVCHPFHSLKEEPQSAKFQSLLKWFTFLCDVYYKRTTGCSNVCFVWRTIINTDAKCYVWYCLHGNFCKHGHDTKLILYPAKCVHIGACFRGNYAKRHGSLRIAHMRRHASLCTLNFHNETF